MTQPLTAEQRVLLLRSLQARVLWYLPTHGQIGRDSMGLSDLSLLQGVSRNGSVSLQENMRRETETDPRMVPADEVDRYEPETRFEDFYLACMLKFGDPEVHALERWAPDFHDYAGSYFYGACHEVPRDTSRWKDVPHSSVLLLQYVLWYGRESRRHIAAEPAAAGPYD
jgi:hypothetical protein